MYHTYIYFFFRSTYVTARLTNFVSGKRFLVMLRKRIKVSVWNNEECRKPYIIVYWRNMTSLLSRIKFEISYLFVVFSFPGIRLIAKHVEQLLFRVVSKYQMTKWFYKSKSMSKKVFFFRKYILFNTIDPMIFWYYSEISIQNCQKISQQNNLRLITRLIKGRSNLCIWIQTKNTMP